jgi:DNA adenine methylase
MIFRFPGSKSKLLTSLTPFLDRLVKGQKVFHDVFTGGGSVALFLAQRYPRLELRLNDLDPDLSAFWRTVAGDGVEALCARIQVRPTVELFHELRDKKAKCEVDRAFRALFFNRCCFSGLLDGSPMGGKWQASPNKVFTRYNAKRLIEEIRDAHRLLSGRTRVSGIDAVDYVRRYPDEAKYLDPPYFEKGDRLYRHRMTLAGHFSLSDALRCSTNWVLSYDRSPVIEELYQWARLNSFATKYSVSGVKRTWARSSELIILPQF